MFLVQFVIRIIKQQYSIRHYKECKLDLRMSDRLFSREIFAFTGWNLFGSIASISVTQVRSVLLNVFFGVQVNASEGISKTASGMVNNVSVSLTRAINPQLVKSEGAGDRQRMIRITCISTKYSVFLFALIAIPVIIEMPFLFKIWLEKVPELAVIFTRWTILSLLLSKFTFEITNAIRAVGEIRRFQLVESLIMVCNLPFAYLFFKEGYPPVTIYFIAFVFSFFTSIYRLYIGEKITGLDIREFLKKSVVPVMIPILLGVCTGGFLSFVVNQGYMRLFLIVIFIPLVMLVSLRYFGLTVYERNNIKSIIQALKSRLLNGK